MVSFLLILLLMLLFVSYYLSGQDLFSPAVVSVTVFVFSTSVVAINVGYWGVDLSWMTILVVVGGLLPLLAGEMLIRMAFRGADKQTKQKMLLNNEIIIQSKWVICTIALMCIYFIYKFECVFSIATLYGSGNSMLGDYRQMITSGDYRVDVIIKFMDLISSCLGYFFTYAYLTNKICLNRTKIIYLLPMLIYLLIIVLSSSRIQYIYFIAYVLVIWYILLQNKFQWSHVFNIKFLRNGFIIFLLFLVSFYFLGYLTNKSTDKDMFDYISAYTGGSIPALNDYLNDFDYNPRNFGSETLTGVDILLDYFGIQGFDTNKNLAFVSFGEAGINTNVYTCYKRLLSDFGYVGMFIVRFLMGILYTYVYMRIKYGKYKAGKNLMIVLYASFFFPIVMQSIDEVFIRSILSISAILQILTFYVLFKVVQNNKSPIANSGKISKG